MYRTFVALYDEKGKGSWEYDLESEVNLDCSKGTNRKIHQVLETLEIWTVLNLRRNVKESLLPTLALFTFC